MKRSWSIALTGVLVAGSVAFAAPAKAAEAACVLGRLPQQTIVDTGSPIQIHVGNAPGYLLTVADVAVDYVNCLRASLSPTVACAKAIAPQTPLVEVDPETLTITIHDENLVGDLSCLFSGTDQ
jgi:hypothetical protein